MAAYINEILFGKLCSLRCRRLYYYKRKKYQIEFVTLKFLFDFVHERSDSEFFICSVREYYV